VLLASNNAALRLPLTQKHCFWPKFENLLRLTASRPGRVTDFSLRAPVIRLMTDNTGLQGSFRIPAQRNWQAEKA
jgi:hypothetical protein